MSEDVRWYAPLEDVGDEPPEGEIEYLRWHLGWLKADHGIEIHFAEGDQYWLWRRVRSRVEHYLNPGNLMPKELFVAFLRGVSCGASYVSRE